MGKSDPTAPPSEQSSSSAQPQHFSSPVSAELQRAPNPQTNADIASFQEPPPDYHTAMSYPSHPMPYQQNASNPAYPKPPYPAQPYPQHMPAPMPINASGYYAVPPSNPVIVQAVRGDVPMLRCAHCPHGVVIRETDVCCLVCLVILAIFTFPFGLLFLCCVPCSIHRRCNACGRIG
ncbi:unnamed protein product, partial [Mesorhabditis belari]|uniref:Membrane protein BRI3 n=1 Tax=Mesorhabditis belari TaxID=2138241 RepID=A0AAF3EY90_9BILA